MFWVMHLLARVAADVWSTVAADWPYLLVSIVAAAAVPVYLGTDRLGAWMSRRRWVAISGAVLLATLTLSQFRDVGQPAGTFPVWPRGDQPELSRFVIVELLG